MQLGFIGLGTMGTPMATNLIEAGYRLRIWNRSPAVLTPLAALGAEIALTPQEVAQGADVLISMLADDMTVRTTIIETGALNKLAADAIHINMATVSVDFAQEMTRLHKASGIHYVAAPVVGRVNVAQAGQLTIFAAGPSHILDRIQPLFDVLGKKTWRFGDKPEQANVAKLAVNFMIASAIETMSEASTLVEGYGIVGADFLEMITSSLFPVPIYQGYGAAIANQQFEPAGFKLSLGSKDIRLVLEAAEKMNIPLPIAALLKDNHLDSMAHGEGHLDWSALSRVAKRRAAQQ